MGQEKVVKAFNEIYDKQKGKIPQLIGYSNTSNIVDVTFRIDEVVPQFDKGIREGIQPYIDRGEIDPDIVQKITGNILKKVVTDRIKLIKAGQGGYGGHAHLRGASAGAIKAGTAKHWLLKPWDPKNILPGTYYLRRATGGAGITFRFVSSGVGRNTGANDTKIQGVARHFRNAVYQDWVNTVGELFGRLPKGGPRTKMKKTITDHTNIAHEEQTTKGAIMLGLLNTLPAVQLSALLTTHDVIKEIEDSIGLNYGRNFKKKRVGKYSFRYFIQTSIRKNKKGSEKTDIVNVKEKHIREAVHNLYVKKMGKYPAILFGMAGSKSPKDQVVEDTVKDIVRPLTKTGRPDFRYKVNRRLKNLKQFRGYKDEFVGKKPKTSKTSKISRITIAVAGTSSKKKGKEKGEGKPANTDDMRELSKLTTYINSRLGAEVRRNHGDDGMLKQQSGIFSRNVRLMSLRPAAKTIVAKYTYMLTGGGTSKNRRGVYQTFENTGVKKWRLSYNPKLLIVKSIRNLAEEQVKQKFNKQLTFRRV